MADFEEFYPLVSKAEGGFQNDHHDTGNRTSQGTWAGTNHGISADFYERITGHTPTEADMRALTAETAKGMIREVYWDKMLRGDELRSQPIANTIGDMLVTSDSAGLRIASQRLWLSGYPVHLQAHEHELRNELINVLNGMDPKAEAFFFNAYNQDRLNYYDDLPKHYDPSKSGWENRVHAHFPEHPVDGWATEKHREHYLAPQPLQWILFNGDSAKLDGSAGPQTQKALVDFQSAYGLEPSGNLDPATRDLLDWMVMNNETARGLGDISESRAAIRDARLAAWDSLQPATSDQPLKAEPWFAEYAHPGLDAEPLGLGPHDHALTDSWRDTPQARDYTTATHLSGEPQVYNEPVQAATAADAHACTAEPAASGGVSDQP